MMAEYIERQAAIDALTERNLVVHMDSVYDGLVASCHRSAQRIIANLPAADLRPVVQARWQYKTMTVPGGKGQTYAKWCCTACKGKAKERTNFCPNCGAMMEES